MSSNFKGNLISFHMSLNLSQSNHQFFCQLLVKEGQSVLVDIFGNDEMEFSGLVNF